MIDTCKGLTAAFYTELKLSWCFQSLGIEFFSYEISRDTN